MTERGRIKNNEYRNIEIDWSGIAIGNITPTDIDGMIEYHNRFIFIEMKYELPYMKNGQGMAFERLVDALPEAILFVCVHDAQPGDVIDAAKTFVSKYYYRSIWRVPLQAMTLDYAVSTYIGKLRDDYYDRF